MTGKDLQNAREQLGWTRTDLATYWSVDYRTIWSWETGTRKIPYPQMVRDALETMARRRLVGAQGEFHTSAKLTEKDIFQIFWDKHSLDVSNTFLANKYGVSPRYMRSILNRKYWSHLEGIDEWVKKAKQSRGK